MTDCININNKNYPIKLKKNVIVICLDGSQKEYFDMAIEKDLMPNLKKLIIKINVQKICGIKLNYLVENVT